MCWAGLARYDMGKDIPGWEHNMFIAQNSCLPGISSIFSLLESWEGGSGRKGDERWVGRISEGLGQGLSYGFEVQSEAYGKLLNCAKQGNDIVIVASWKVHSQISTEWFELGHIGAQKMWLPDSRKEGVLLMRLTITINNTLCQRLSDQEKGKINVEGAKENHFVRTRTWNIMEYYKCVMGRTVVVGRLEKIPWRREPQPAPVFWPGEFHGQSSVAGYIQSTASQRVGHDWATNTFTFSQKKVRIKIHPYFSPINKSLCYFQFSWLPIPVLRMMPLPHIWDPAPCCSAVVANDIFSFLGQGC